MSRVAWLAILAFWICVPLGGVLVRALRDAGIGKRIRSDGPDHQAKAGTPTMGGLLFVVACVLSGLVMLILGRAQALWPALAVLAFGILGAFDDLRGLRDVEGVGWLARFKFPWQWAVALAISGGMFLAGAMPALWVPWGDRTLELGAWMVPLGAFLMVGMVNAINITDGLDGLSAGCGALVAFLMTILLSTGGHPELAAWSAVLTGALLAFLWHNAHPARVFMGDVGAEGLGAALAVLALASGNVLLLLVASLAILAGPGSVTLQVAWFKYTRRRYGQGRRIFRIAPLHHHFERLGLNEVQITVRYWIVTAAACLAALALWGAI